MPETRTRRVQRLLGPLLDPMVLLLMLAAPTYALIGDTSDALVALVALVPVIGVGWLLEARAERTLERLAQLTAPVATVVRDGDTRSIPAKDIVVGDAIRVREGDVVPADAVVTVSTQISIDESSLTGESLPVSKITAPDDWDQGFLWAGTTVLSGDALAVVTATGSGTRYGALGRLVAESSAPATPLQRALGRLVRIFAGVAAVFCVAVVIAELAHGHGWGDAVIAGVSLAIAAIPEEFAMVYALYLALGAWRLAQTNALARRLPSVETLGSTTVICTDKTGTLTEGRLTVERVWTPRGGMQSLADASRDGSAITELLTEAVRASEPEPFDPLDVAVVRAAVRYGIDVDRLHADELESDWPFDTVDRYVTHVWRLPDGRRHVASKGSLEGVLAHADVIADLAEAAATANGLLSEDGLRVIAVAASTSAASSSVVVSTGEQRSRVDDESALHLVGLVGFADPIRTEVPHAIDQCREAGVRVVMMTGDHADTARTIGQRLGLVDGAGEVVTGRDLDAATPDDLAELVARATIFARIRPEQKSVIVDTLRSQGEVVAMTGDGVNDAPALRVADIGVAMGERGTDVAREASSIVLLDDNFSTIVRAIRDGRRIVDNLVAAFAYLIAFHPPLMFAALIVPLLGQPLMLLPVHFVVLELILHPVVSLVFQADPARDDTMRRPPRSVGASFGIRSFARPYLVGVVLAAELIAVYLVGLHVWEVDEARGLAFVALLASQPVLVLSMRTEVPFWRDLRWTRTLLVVAGLVVLVIPSLVFIGPLADVVHLEPFPVVGWLGVLGVMASAAVMEVGKRHRVS